jgi:GH24 family phage-related lysozyme (muramidase)
MANDLQLKIGADNRELVRVLESSRRSASDFTSSLQKDSASLDSVLNALNVTLRQVAENTQQTADATQHLSTLTDIFLVYTGVKLLAGAVTSAANGVAWLGQQAAGAAVKFDEWARSTAYVVGQTNAVRVANDHVDQGLKILTASALDYAVAYGAVNYATLVGSTALTGVTLAARATTTAFTMAASAAADFALAVGARMLSPVNFAASVVYSAVAIGLQKLTQEYGRLSIAVQEWYQWAQLYNSAQLEGAARMIALTGSISKFSSEMQRLGFDNATRGLQSFMAELMKIPGMTTDVAAQIEAGFGSIQPATGEINAALIQSVRLLANSKEEAKAWSDAIVPAFNSPETNGEKFLRSLGDIDAKFLENLEHAKETGNAYRMQAALLDGLVKVAQRAKEAASQRAEEEIHNYTSLGLSRDAAISLLGWFDANVAKLKELNTEADAQIGKITEMRDRLQDMAMTQEDIRRKAFDIARAYGTPSAAIEKLTSDIKVLRTASQGVTDDAAKMIKQFEGFKPKAFVDSDQRYRVGYSSDTFVDPSGKVREVTERTTVTVEQANADLDRRIREIQNGLTAQIGDDWDRLSARTRASITSIVYNYGAGNKKLISELKAAASQGDEAVSKVIRARASDNGGVNAGRRMLEADNITSDLSAEQVTKYDEALRIAESRLKQINDIRQGGSVTQQTELAIAQSHAQGIADEVAEHSRLVEALNTELATEKDIGRQSELKKRIATEQSQIRELEISRMRAAAELEAAAFEVGTKERYQILKAELDKEAELRANEPDKLREVKRRQVTVTDEFEYQKARVDQTDEDAEFQEKVNRFREEATVARELTVMKKIDDDQLQATLLKNLKDREDAEREHWQRIQEIWGEGTNQYNQAQKRLTALTSKYSLERAGIQRQFNQQTFKEYESTFRSIYQSISSSMTGVLMGQQKLSQGIRSVLSSMLQMVLSKLVEKAAAWSATMALELTTTQATEAGKTAAVAGGEASRTGLMAAGGVAQLATRGMTMLKSILASAAETFAGVFAFLSPVMGPAAAGPAAAAQGTVAAQAAAVAAFDIGAWEIPGDQLAMVHRRELVMPAAEADAFRKFLSGGLEHRVTGNQVPSTDARRLETEGGKSDLAKTLPSFISQVASTIERTTERAPGAQAQSHSDLVAAIKAAVPATGQGVAHLAKLAGDGGARIAGALTVLPVLAGPAAASASPVRDLATIIRQAGDSGVAFDAGASAERGVSVSVTNSYGEIFGREARMSTLDLRSLAAAGGKDAQADHAAGKALPRAADRVATVLSDTLARSDVTSASSHAQFRSELTSTLERSFPATAHGLTQLVSLASGEGARAASLMSVLPTTAQPGIADLKSFHALSNFINHESSPIDSINSYAIGAWNIPNDQLAVLHRRELVMPVNEATAFRNLLTASPGGEGVDRASGGSGGTHNHHYNISPTINAVDARSVKRLFSSHSSELMEAFSKSVKLGHHLTKPNLRPS